MSDSLRPYGLQAPLSTGFSRQEYRSGLPFYYSVIKKKTAFESVLMRWMKLEPIIQSEVNPKKKHQYSILMYIYIWNLERLITTLYERQRKRHRCKKQTFWTIWEKVRVGWFERIAFYTIYKRDDQCKFDAWSRALETNALGQLRGME